MDGVLIIDKPAGWTSHDVVARVRRVLRERRTGHTGTLDPFATGVLVVLVGRATRLAQFLSGAEKEYDATVRFGYATETGDLTGARREQPPRMETAAAGDGANAARTCAEWSGEEIERALESLRGEIEQVPPMYSAKKVGGRKLYELARRGIEIERAAVRVRVRELEVLAIDGAPATQAGGADESWAGSAHESRGGGGDEPRAGSGDESGTGGARLRGNADGTCDLRVRVACSAGTYVRVLAEDLGARLGTGAHLAALRRTRAGAFDIAQAVTLEHLEQRAEAGLAGELLITPDAALPELPFVHLTAEDARRVRHGASVRVGDDGGSFWREGERVRMRDAAGTLLAIGVYDRTRGELRPRVMLDGGGEK
ncbi:MAG TPA: tRNA pseudouridine(55) synthase TruB [Pyrinomonadaceae bacterium]|nr:tRNA pseudouridine(55) synthase TruB [Pyrinomonadaceae bacterium]